MHWQGFAIVLARFIFRGLVGAVDKKQSDSAQTRRRSKTLYSTHKLRIGTVRGFLVVWCGNGLLSRVE